jgi:hypothetical protein
MRGSSGIYCSVFYSTLIAEINPALEMNFLAVFRHSSAGHTAPAHSLIPLVTTLRTIGTANTTRFYENGGPFG